MAIFKWIPEVHPSKSGNPTGGMNRLVDYVINPQKTDGGLLVGSVGCIPETAVKEMIETKKYFGKLSLDPHERLMYHAVISFSPEEKIDKEIALKIIQEFVDSYLKNEYEAVYSIHADQKHMHGHIAFNSVNSQTGYKFRYERKQFIEYILPMLDSICQKYGVNTLSMDTGISVEEYKEEQKKKYQRKPKQGRKQKRNKYYKEEKTSYTKNDFIKNDIDESILLAHTYDEFIQVLKERGYMVSFGKSEKYGDVLKLKAFGSERFRRTYALGKDYGVENIKKRIDVKNKPLPVVPRENNMRLIMPVKYMRFKVAPQNKYVNRSMRIYYARLYRMGIKTKHKYSNYYEVKKTISRIRDLESELLLAQENNIVDLPSAKKAAENKKMELLENERRKKQYFSKRQPYNKLIKNYKLWSKLNQKNELNEEEQEEYISCQKIMAAYGHDEDTVCEFVNSINQELREINREKKKIEKDLKKIEEIVEEYATMDNEQLEVDYENYCNIFNPGENRKTQGKNK